MACLFLLSSRIKLKKSKFSARTFCQSQNGLIVRNFFNPDPGKPAQEFDGHKANGQISKQVFQKKTKRAKFSEKQTLGGKKCLFFGKFDVLCFLETPVWRFALLPYNRRIATFKKKKKFHPIINLNSIQVKRGSYQKHLGILLNEKPTFKQVVDNAFLKINQRYIFNNKTLT